MKTAFITGVNGQDGAYLTRLLLEKGYFVHGMIRRASLERNERIEDILNKITLHYGDMTDSSALIRLVQMIQPDEIYNLAAQSHVHTSFETPEYTANADALGTLRLLEAIRICNLEKKTRFYQASTSELYGNAQLSPQNETTPFAPSSPYAAAKLYAYWAVRTYRDAYGLHATNGILFNHESPMRGENFVSRKITMAAARAAKGYDSTLMLGNIDARRDWGHATDYVRGMWLIMQQKEPDDYVLATGRSETVRWFAERAYACAGINLEWQGQGTDECAYDTKTNRLMIQIDPKLYRPIDVTHLRGDASKAAKMLGWKPEISLEEMIDEMVQCDLQRLT